MLGLRRTLLSKHRTSYTDPFQNSKHDFSRRDQPKLPDRYKLSTRHASTLPSPYRHNPSISASSPPAQPTRRPRIFKQNGFENSSRYMVAIGFIERKHRLSSRLEMLSGPS